MPGLAFLGRLRKGRWPWLGNALRLAEDLLKPSRCLPASSDVTLFPSIASDLVREARQHLSDPRQSCKPGQNSRGNRIGRIPAQAAAAAAHHALTWISPNTDSEGRSKAASL